MDSYVQDGIVPAMRHVDGLHGNDGINVVGYCIGGTTLALTLAWLAKTKQDNPAKSATFFTALTDFEDPGPLKAFIDEGFISGIMIEAQRKGYLDQKIMARTFSYLRPNDLVYGPAVKAYLLGEPRPKFDLLFWNEDSTRLPERMAREYLTYLYRDNRFAAGGFDIAGVTVALDDIKIPHYAVACEKDHIAGGQLGERARPRVELQALHERRAGLAVVLPFHLLHALIQQGLRGVLIGFGGRRDGELGRDDEQGCDDA
jgi:polyhydroxyalkanoate synthase